MFYFRLLPTIVTANTRVRRAHTCTYCELWVAQREKPGPVKGKESNDTDKPTNRQSDREKEREKIDGPSKTEGHPVGWK